jgi:hypothetical protein
VAAFPARGALGDALVGRGPGVWCGDRHAGDTVEAWAGPAGARGPAPGILSTLLAFCGGAERRMANQVPFRHGSTLSHDAVLGAMLVALVLCAVAPIAGRATGQQLQTALQDTPLTQYRAFRRMHAKNERFNQEGWIDAWTELDGGAFKYEIATERGSEYIRNKVLRTLLTREQELVNNGEAGRADISHDNYSFQEDSADSEGFRYVLLKPKRKDVLLVNGRMVLNPAGTALLRVEGTLAKNPSFWTSTVNIVREFAMVDGVRVPVTTATVAKLKFAGEAQLDVRYEYRTVNGRQVDPTTVVARR